MKKTHVEQLKIAQQFTKRSQDYPCIEDVYVRGPYLPKLKMYLCFKASGRALFHGSETVYTDFVDIVPF